MRVYQVSFEDGDTNSTLEWFGNQRDADRSAAERRRAGQDPVIVRPFDVPTDKAGLLAWLNLYVTTDNG